MEMRTQLMFACIKFFGISNKPAPSTYGTARPAPLAPIGGAWAGHHVTHPAMHTFLHRTLSLFVVSALSLTASLSAQTPVAPQSYKVAIVTTNRAGTVGDTELGALEDYVTGKVTNLGVQVISAETMMNAVGNLAPHAQRAKLDQEMDQATSAIRLAQTLGADYLMQVTLTGFDSNARNVDAYGVKNTSEERVVRVTYKILDGTTGASLASDTVRVTKSFQQTKESTDNRSSVVNDLLEEAAGKVAVSLQRAIARGRIAAPAAGAAAMVTVNLTTEVADLYVPDVRINAENTISISESKFKVSALSATVEIDGLAVGTAPGAITAKPGLHKLRVVREGFKPWERTVNLTNGLNLAAALEMSDAAYAKWKDASSFMNNLKNGAKLTDAEVKKLEGEAKMLEQSGFKVNTTDAPVIQQHRSIFGL
ncbi:MAG: PEGA domain-containing protein [Opitutus sp.]|nr:PEGA domain-containing protein [Opitutus sp.]